MLSQDDGWYFAAASGSAEGPVSLAALRAMRRAGHVTDDTPVWCSALADWLTFGQAIGKRAVPAPPPLPTRRGAPPQAEEESADEGSAEREDAARALGATASQVDANSMPARLRLRRAGEGAVAASVTGLGVPRPSVTAGHRRVVSGESEESEEGDDANGIRAVTGDASLLEELRKGVKKDGAASSVWPRRSKWRLLLAAVGLVGVLVLIDQGLVLASPDYHDRRARQQVLWGMEVAAKYQSAVASALERGMQPWQINNETLGLAWRPLSAHVGAIHVNGGRIVLEYGRHSVWRIKGKLLTYRAYYGRDGSVRWACGYENAVPAVALVEAIGEGQAGRGTGVETTVEAKYLPYECRPAGRLGHEADDCRGRAATEDGSHCRSDLPRMAEAVPLTNRAGVKAYDARAASLRAEREAQLQRMVATEAKARATSGVLDDYRAQLMQAVARNWIRPPSARGGMECTVYVRQTPEGDVEDITVGRCDGDEAVRESIVGPC